MRTRPPLGTLHLGLAAAIGLSVSACGDPRALVDAQPVTGAERCDNCHGTPPAKDAHLAHAIDLAGASTQGALPRAPIKCLQCHKDVRNVNDPDHIFDANGRPLPAPAVVRFDDPAAIAGRTQPGASRTAAPVYDPVTRTCSNVWCHGAAQTGTTPDVILTPRWDLAPGSIACGRCHGIPPAGHTPGLARTDCHRCHGDAIDSAGVLSPTAHVNGTVDLGPGVGTSCAACHGDGSANVPPGDPRSAPPRDALGRPASDPAAIGIGAHQTHLSGGASGRAVACGECHVVPASLFAAGHIDGKKDVRFDPSGLAVKTEPGATRPGPPAFDAATRACSNVYCHGSGLQGVSAGVIAAPSWNAEAGSIACGSCHGIPPATHPQTLTLTDCQRCHGSAISASGVPNRATHVNGTVDLLPGVATSCAACHGSGAAAVAPGDPASAPPLDAEGRQAGDPAAKGIGAHQAHVRGGTLGVAVACSECHVVPGDVLAAGHVDGQVTVNFGPLAKKNGTPAAFAPATQTCSNVYCHGGFNKSSANPLTPPTWNGGSAAVACGSCHDLPPPVPTHVDLKGVPGCNSNPNFPALACHPSPYTPTSVDPTRHINGTIDLGP
jgi:predicted CxxxxCH...CXXCH cytochrome family protein